MGEGSERSGHFTARRVVTGLTHSGRSTVVKDGAATRKVSPANVKCGHPGRCLRRVARPRAEGVSCLPQRGRHARGPLARPLRSQSPGPSTCSPNCVSEASASPRCTRTWTPPPPAADSSSTSLRRWRSSSANSSSSAPRRAWLPPAPAAESSDTPRSPRRKSSAPPATCCATRPLHHLDCQTARRLPGHPLQPHPGPARAARRRRAPSARSADEVGQLQQDQSQRHFLPELLTPV